MNVLWEVLLKARQQGFDEKELRFVIAKDYSAYMEVSNICLNEDTLRRPAVIEFNPYYRFYDIFRDMYQPDVTDFPELRESLTNLLLHQLAQNDIVSGMTREEYYKELLYRDLDGGAFGTEAARAIRLFKRDSREVILSGLLRQYQTGSSLDIFRDMVEELIPCSIVYHSNSNANEVLVYVGLKKGRKIMAKMDFLVEMFIELPYSVDVYYEYHFGILGMEDTMRIDEIMMY